MRICVDIETLPSDDPEVVTSYPSRVRQDLKDPVKIAEAATKLWSKSSVDPIEARICSIAVRSSADVGEVVTSEVDDVVWDLVNDANLDVMTRHA